jgi:hypothetical protein
MIWLLLVSGEVNGHRSSGYFSPSITIILRFSRTSTGFPTKPKEKIFKNRRQLLIIAIDPGIGIAYACIWPKRSCMHESTDQRPKQYLPDGGETAL